MHRWFWLALTVLCVSCSAAVRTPESAPPHASLPADSSVIHIDAPRALRVVILADKSSRVPQLTNLLNAGSQVLFAQIGVTLTVCDIKIIKWRSQRRLDVLRQVAEEMEDFGKPYDIAIAARPFTAPQLLQYLTVGAWEGQIDDTYRRFIVLRRLTVQVLLHEVCHAFLFSTVHSVGLRNLMTPVAFYVVPGVLPLNRSTYLYEADRTEIMRNKWRDFDVPPRLSPACRDTIEAPKLPSR